MAGRHVGIQRRQGALGLHDRLALFPKFFVNGSSLGVHSAIVSQIRGGMRAEAQKGQPRDQTEDMGVDYDSGTRAQLAYQGRQCSDIKSPT